MPQPRSRPANKAPKNLALHIEWDNESNKPRIRSVARIAKFGRSELLPAWQHMLADWKKSGYAPKPGCTMIAMARPSATEIKHTTTEILSACGLADAIGELDVSDESGLLICRGSTFHADSMYWPESVFLTHYLDGPPMELQIPHAGLKKILHPGDSFVFDPAAPHALFEPGKGLFDLSEATPVSTFISIDIPLTPLIEQRLGIKRFDYVPAGHLLMDGASEIDKESGAYALDVLGQVMNHAELALADNDRENQQQRQ